MRDLCKILVGIPESRRSKSRVRGIIFNIIGKRRCDVDSAD